MENGRNKDVSFFIVDWENGTCFACIMTRKCALTLHSCISVIDKVKTNELNKPIVLSSTYTPNFETLLPEAVAVLNPMVCRVSLHWYGACESHQI